MKVLVINCGSSSIKYRLIDLRNDRVLTDGEVQRIGEGESRLQHRWTDALGEARQLARSEALADHEEAFRAIEAALRTSGSMSELETVAAIGHRVVHGGEAFQAPALIDDATVAGIREVCALAPLHNPANLTGIEICLALFPGVPQVAVFDTAFHHSLPPQAYRYAIPDAWYTEHQVRRYGFHGTSHAYVARQAADYLQQAPAALNLITLHLGNGASAAAVRAGRCVDTSMGFTPLEGLMMGTRCGDIDPAMLFHIRRATGADMDELESALNTESGLKGICGVNDMREIQQRADAGDAAALLAIDMYCYRIKKYIGAYCAVLGRVDALVFTAGIGENSALVRQRACEGLDALGIVVDDARNTADAQPPFEIQADGGSVRLLVIATNEELEIARQAAACIEGQS
ncbi:MAG: acetate kinase [Thiogranum sp.]|nr:acetate kinase [Thiogranum sp.]